MVRARGLRASSEERSERPWRGACCRPSVAFIGKPGAETPTGLFYVTWKFNPAIDPNWSILGAYAFETSAYSKHTDWPGGGIVGVHGTPWPALLGQAVSHGCVRMSNENVEFLHNRVPLGTPVKIVR
jgi:lipoprotein-anchoring transpeptidase ErfK/SrfK